jgi:hypothetical protein
LECVPITVVPAIVEFLNDFMCCLLSDCLLLADKDKTIDIALPIRFPSGDTAEQDDPSYFGEVSFEFGYKIPDWFVKFWLRDRKDWIVRFVESNSVDPDEFLRATLFSRDKISSF